MTLDSDHEIETGSFAPQGRAQRPRNFIRVVNWNIDRGLRLRGIIDFLSGTEADLIMLQEVDFNARRTHHLNIAREIAQKLGLNYAFGREFQELTQGPSTSPAYHGQATLSRWPIARPRILRFRRQSNFWKPRWFLPEIQPFQERIGGRIALVADVQIADRTLATYNLHLESRGDDSLRFSQLNECFEDPRNCEGRPIILAGDLNMDVVRNSVVKTIRREKFNSVIPNVGLRATTPNSMLNRGRVIDWIFIRGFNGSARAEVHTSVSASDHYPLSADLILA